jgi:hypothetical protein
MSTAEAGAAQNGLVPDYAKSLQGLSKALVSTKKVMGAELKTTKILREHLIGTVYHYAVDLQVGPGEFDKIRMHRIVKEQRPWLPIKTKECIMTINGDLSNFNCLFMGSHFSNAVPEGYSLGVYLAEKNVDVWGLDQRWALVPEDVTDFSFMRNWDTALHLKDIQTVTKLCRYMRLAEGNGYKKILMLGMSRGVQYLFAYADAETQVPQYERDLKGIIPIDMAYKYEKQASKEAALVRYQVFKALYDAGVYYSSDGAGIKYLAYLAAAQPEEPSETIPGFNNKQAFLFTAAATYATFPPPMEPYEPFYHNLAGLFDDDGIPIGLQFTDYDYVLDLALEIPPYQSLAEMIDGEAITSGLVENPYDDHLNAITIPVFYIGAAGGEGEPGSYVLTLLGSQDKKMLVIGLYPPEAVALDFGHGDLLWAGNAKQLVWKPIYQWIKQH